MTLKTKIKELSDTYIDEIIAIRRHIHQHPELSFQEEKTAAYVVSKLKAFGIKYKTGFAKNGILGIIEGAKPGKTVALRADMDALPVQEEVDVPFKSENVGKMHACGHDVHTASLLGAAKILNQLKPEISGRILLVFQPAEERIPGGAKIMMEDGLFDEYAPDLIIGQHVYPELEAGKVGFKPGHYMASSDEIYITCKGKGGHAALPYNTVDTVLMASQIIVSMQQVVSRFIPTQIPSVLSFGNIVCKSVMNVIPESVELQGTFRIMDEDYRYKSHKKIIEIAKHTAQAMGGDVEVEIKVGFPSLYNNPEATEKSIKLASEMLGNKNVVPLDIRMTAEDFAWYAQKYPAVFYRLGVNYPDEKDCGGLHTPGFNPNEAAIKTGVEMLAWLAIDTI